MPLLVKLVSLDAMTEEEEGPTTDDVAVVDTLGACAFVWVEPDELWLWCCAKRNLRRLLARVVAVADIVSFLPSGGRGAQHDGHLVLLCVVSGRGISSGCGESFINDYLTVDDVNIFSLA